MTITVLERPLYSMSEAARLLEIRNSTKLRRWVDGFRMQERDYPPVIRVQHTGSDTVTWAEFVEAGYLREYRTHLSLQRLRPLIDEMRRDFGVPYPLAHFKPLVDPEKRELVLRRQEESDLDPRLGFVKRGEKWQVVWTDAMESFLEKVEFDADGVALRMHPLGKSSPVTIDPEVAFGIPQVGGIRTETLAESYASGEPLDAVAQSWGLTVPDVEAAVRWELRLVAKAS